jgi:uncharacterized protein YjbJ (UPF0337 family)
MKNLTATPAPAQGNWNNKKGNVKENLAIITDNDPMTTNGSGKKKPRVGKPYIQPSKTK